MIFKKFFNKDVDKINFFVERFGLSPRITELILSRGINTEEGFEEFLNPRVSHDPFLLKGMKEAKNRILLAKEIGDRVVIFGDYDVDGVSATAIMLKTLKKIGISANYFLPNRYIDGYGLTCETIDKVIAQFDPQLIITVDCGISCYKEVEYAKNKGVDVIVTDHHEIPEILPDTIVINPKIEGQGYPFRELCGTGVAYKISQALLGNGAEEFLPIAGIATIADIVPLIDENRTIVTRGMELLSKFLPYGLKELFKDNKLPLSKVTAGEISFKIAPKINASGRMGDASDSLMLYLETDPVKIKKYIEKIKSHNTKRQDICNKIYEDCERALKKISMKDLRVISLASTKWDQGVLGIVCSRLVEKYHKPTFLFAQVGDTLHGSGRSIDDINIHELLSSLQDILETYGGHSMAAGLTLKRLKYEEFTKRVNAFVHDKINDKVFIPITYYDQDIQPQEITSEFLQELKRLEPIGCGNPRPKFKITANEVSIERMKRFPQHANIGIEDLSLVFFNYTGDFEKMLFSRQKSFVFELQGEGKKGVVSHFDGGSFITEKAYEKVAPLEIQQLEYEKNADAKYTYYNRNELVNFVASTMQTVFGTAFVTFSAHEYVNLSKNYSTQGIFHFGVCDYSCVGYNSLILSPIGLDWAKNFSKIVFLSPILDEGYIAELNKITNAEIYVPIDKKFESKKFSKVDLSRNTFGKIFSLICNNINNVYVSIFDLYEKVFKEQKIDFLTYFSALSVFKELGLLKLNKEDLLRISYNRGNKRQLMESRIYNKLSMLKNLVREDDRKN